MKSILTPKWVTLFAIFLLALDSILNRALERHTDRKSIIGIVVSNYF